MCDGFEEAWALSSPIDGWLTKEQALALYEAARGLPSEASIVEIGSHHGRSTVLLGKAKTPGARLVAIDPYEDTRWGGGSDAYEIFLSNLRQTGLAGEVEVFRTTSAGLDETVLGSAFGLVYVDGAHDRESVLQDIDRWRPLVIEGGFVYLHDAFSSVGVTFALLQRSIGNRSFRYLGSVGTLARFRREDLSWRAASWSTLRLLGRLGYFCRNLVIKIALRRGSSWIPPLLGHRGSHHPY